MFEPSTLTFSHDEPMVHLQTVGHGMPCPYQSPPDYLGQSIGQSASCLYWRPGNTSPARIVHFAATRCLCSFSPPTELRSVTGSSRICSTEISASRPTSRLPIRSCQPITRAASTVHFAIISSKLRPIGKNLVSTVGKSPTTPKPGWLKRPCRSELM